MQGCHVLGSRPQRVRAWAPQAGCCALSMLSFSLAEIIFLRAITPAYPANHADIIFDITEGNLRDSFDIIKRYMDGMTVGEWPETSRCPDTSLSSSQRLGQGLLCQSGRKTSQDQPSSYLSPLPKADPTRPSGPSWNPHTPESVPAPGVPRVAEPAWDVPLAVPLYCCISQP